MTIKSNNSEHGVIGLDFGTLSVRGVFINKEGMITQKKTIVYENGIYEDEDNFALQINPYDWIEAGEKIINYFISNANGGDGGDDYKNVENIGIGISFTSCTIIPVNSKGQPMLNKMDFTKENAKLKPSYFPKLWKHHSVMSQKMADELNVGLHHHAWLHEVYGGKIGCEWLLPKTLEIYFTDRECFDSIYAFIEAGDFVAFQLCESRKNNSTAINNIPRSACQLGYKGTFNTETNQYYVTSEDLRRIFKIDNSFAIEKILDKRGNVLKPGLDLVGEFKTGIYVYASIIDAHAGSYFLGCQEDETLACILGTSGCLMINTKAKPNKIDGIAGIVLNGIAPSYYGIECGLASFGDNFDFLSRFTKQSLTELEKNRFIFRFI